MQEYGLTIVIGVAAGTLTRFLILRSDYRHYPGYPHGYVTHIFLGFIAASLGAVAVPALVEKEFTAVTFLALAAQQFREVRNMERESLAQLEREELVPRGLDYVEGIARVFEARNYLVMGTALIVSAATYFISWIAGLAGGMLAVMLSSFLMRGETVGELADVIGVKPHFNGAFLQVGDIVIMNVGLRKAREKILNEGLGAILKPKNDNARATLHDAGQRQAILNTVAALIGTKREIGEPEWHPLARKNIDTGEIGLFILPNEKDEECLLEAIRRVPVLESAKRTPLKTYIGKAAED